MVGRYGFAQAIPWAEEVLVFVMLWMVFLVAGSIAYLGTHINMDLFYSTFPRAAKRVINAAIALSFIVCCSFVAVQSFSIVRLHHAAGSVSFGSGLPNWIPALAVFVGFSLTAIAVLVRFRNYLNGSFD